MKKTYFAVPREDGGWKILVQIIPQAENGEDERGGKRPPGNVRPGIPPEPTYPLPGIPPAET